MTIQNIVEQSYQVFLEHINDVSLLLLHPQSRYRSVLMAHLANTKDFTVYHYGIGPDDVNLRSFLTSISNSLANQHPMFGRHLNILPHDVLDDPMKHFDLVLETFVKDLGEMSEAPFLLILDEYDRSDRADEVQLFIENVSALLPPHAHLVINSRTLPRLPWVSMIAQGRAVMLRDDTVIDNFFYDRDYYTRRSGTMEVFALGQGFVMSNNTPIENWEGHLPRLLFFFALDKPIVTRSEICQAFWPDLEADQAVNVFHVTKRRLHKALDADVLVHRDGYYRINPDLPIYYDAMEFVDLLMQARQNDDSSVRMKAWQRVSELYRGPFLLGHDERWINARRVEFRDGYLEAMTGLAGLQRAAGDPESALATLQKAVDADLRRNDIHKDIMSLFAEMGRHAEATEYFQKLEQTMDEGNMEVAEDIRSHYQSLMV